MHKWRIDYSDSYHPLLIRLEDTAFCLNCDYWRDAAGPKGQKARLSDLLEIGKLFVPDGVQQHNTNFKIFIKEFIEDMIKEIQNGNS